MGIELAFGYPVKGYPVNNNLTQSPVVGAIILRVEFSGSFNSVNSTNDNMDWEKMANKQQVGQEQPLSPKAPSGYIQ